MRAKRELEDNGDRFGLVADHKRGIGFIQFAESYLSNYGKRDVRMVKYALKKFEDFLIDRNKPKVCA